MCPFGNNHRTRRGGYQPPAPARPLARHGSMRTSTPTSFHRTRRGRLSAARLCQAACAAWVDEDIDPYKFPPPGGPRAQKKSCHNRDRIFLAGDEGFEPPQTESESGVLPLHKSPMPSPLKRHLLLYAKIAVCQGLFFSARTCSFSRSSRRIRDRDTGVIPRKDATCRWGTRSITPG